jgi:hypothetical protein
MIWTFGIIAVVGVGMMLTFSGIIFDHEEEVEDINISSWDFLWTNTQFTFGNMGNAKSVCNKNILHLDGAFNIDASCERTTRISGITSSGMILTGNEDSDLLNTCHTRDLSPAALYFNENFNEEAFNANIMEKCRDKRTCDGSDAGLIAPEVFLYDPTLVDLTST